MYEKLNQEMVQRKKFEVESSKFRKKKVYKESDCMGEHTSGKCTQEEEHRKIERWKVVKVVNLLKS